MLINVLKLGSHCQEVMFGRSSSFMSRAHIKLPNSPIKKWGKEYILLRQFVADDVLKICNGNEGRFFNIDAEITTDRHGISYLNAYKNHFEIDKKEYWLTVVSGMNATLNRNQLIADSEGKSQIFSMAFNHDSPAMFEAILILKRGSIVKIGDRDSVFCPETNPFLEK